MYPVLWDSREHVMIDLWLLDRFKYLQIVYPKIGYHWNRQDKPYNFKQIFYKLIVFWGRYKLILEKSFFDDVNHIEL